MPRGVNSAERKVLNVRYDQEQRKSKAFRKLLLVIIGCTNEEILPTHSRAK